jgi:hypothetical protein
MIYLLEEKWGQAPARLTAQMGRAARQENQPAGTRALSGARPRLGA